MTNALLYCGHMTLGNNHAISLVALGGSNKFYAKTKLAPKLLVTYLEEIVAALECLVNKGVKKVMLFLNHTDCWKMIQGLYRTTGYRKQLLKKIEKLREQIEIIVSWVSNDSALDHVTKNAWNLLVNGVLK